MSIIGLLLVLVVIGVALYVLNTLPMAPPIKTIINAIVVLLVLFWLLEEFGVLSTYHHPLWRIR